MERSICLVLLLSALCPLSSCVSRQYYFVNMNMSWAEAQSYCRQNYTDLATIDSTGEMNTLLSSVYTGYTGAAWIGLYNNGWKWSLDGRSLDGGGGTLYANWSSGEPSNDLAKNCVRMSDNGQWLTEKCDYGWHYVCYDGRANASLNYVGSSLWKTWSDAQTFCRAQYTDLASVRNQSENQQITSLVPLGFSVWIGLYRDSWKWSNGENATFQSWSTMQANNNAKDAFCVVQWSSGDQKWTSMPCSQQLPFVCYKDIPNAANSVCLSTAALLSSVSIVSLTVP